MDEVKKLKNDNKIASNNITNTAEHAKCLYTTQVVRFIKKLTKKIIFPFLGFY